MKRWSTVCGLGLFCFFLCLGTNWAGAIDIAQRDDPVDCTLCLPGIQNCEECNDGRPVIRTPRLAAECSTVGGLAAIQVCVEEELDPFYNVTNTTGGVNITTASNAEPACLGVSENRPEVDFMTISLSGSNHKVARIHKLFFDGAPVGGIFGQDSVTVEVNQRSFTVLTNVPNIDMLNDAMFAAISAHFDITEYADYWIVGADLTSGEWVTRAGIETNDEDVVAMQVEVRPRRSDPSRYDFNCGEGDY